MIVYLHQLPKIVTKSKKRVGRGVGSGAGAKSGRGTTRHQAARENIPLHFEGGQNRLVKKFPLLRGKGKNASLASSVLPVRLERLNVIPEGERVTVDTLVKYRIIKQKDANKMNIKIVGGGSLAHPLIIDVPATRAVKKKLKKA